MTIVASRWCTLQIGCIFSTLTYLKEHYFTHDAVTSNFTFILNVLICEIFTTNILHRTTHFYIYNITSQIKPNTVRFVILLLQIFGLPSEGFAFLLLLHRATPPELFPSDQIIRRIRLYKHAVFINLVKSFLVGLIHVNKEQLLEDDLLVISAKFCLS